MACEHKWRASADTVECVLCGEKLTGNEYSEMVRGKHPDQPETNQPDPADKPKRARKAKVDE